MPARELLDYGGKLRRHTQAQRDALRGLLEQVGIAGVVTAYHPARNGGRLTLIGGHLRRQDHDLDWPRRENRCHRTFEVVTSSAGVNPSPQKASTWE